MTFFAINATKFNSETLKKAIIKNIARIITATTNHTHFSPELLKVEKAQREKITQIAKTISCIKLTENHITEKATHEKNHFLIC